MKNKGFFGWTFKILAIILLITPLLFLTIKHKDTWFVKGADKISIGFIMTLLFAIMLLKGAFKNLDKRLMTAITLLVFSVIVWLLETIIQDLFWILICSFVGYLLYLLLDTIGNKLVETHKVYRQEHIREKARIDFNSNVNNDVKGIGRA